MRIVAVAGSDELQLRVASCEGSRQALAEGALQPGR